MKKVVVFDLDDTLYKEIDFLKSAYQEIADWLHKSYHKNDVYPFMWQCYRQGKNVFEAVNQYFELNTPIEIYLNKYRTHMPQISLSDEVKYVLATCSQKGYTLGLMTDGRELTQRNKINALKLVQYINEADIVISESFGYSKPSKEGYVYFQNKYPNTQYYYVGDNVKKDFISANLLGWTTICLKDDGRNIHRQTAVEKEFEAKYLIETMSELLGILSENQ